MTVALALLTVLAALLVVAGWWIRRCNLATRPSPLAGRVAPGCDLGQQLLMANSAQGPIQPGESGSRRSGPTRRAFLRNSMAGAWLVTLGGFGGATLAYLWPDLRGGFGAELELGDRDEILSQIQDQGAPFEDPAGRAYLIDYDPDLDPDGAYAEVTGGAPLMALFWTCPHLGCRVPFCESSQWFECPCHQSRYNRWGEWTGGPAPRGMDRFPLEVTDDGQVIVDTSEIIDGPSRAAAVLDQPPEGASCL